MNRKKESHHTAHETWDRFCDMIGHCQPVSVAYATSLYCEEPAGVKVVGLRFIVLYECELLCTGDQSLERANRRW